MTGIVDVKGSILRSCGNWSDKFQLENAKLDLALRPPTNPTLLNAFNENIKSIQTLEEML